MHVGRFAPSPTGPLHAGSLLAAVAGWLCARHAGGRWLLRMEDIDPLREVPGAGAGILDALAAFGLTHDGVIVYQSQHGHRYQQALDRLTQQELAFPCWCSRRDLAAHDGMHQDGRCVRSPDDLRPPSWRLRVPDIDIAFEDALMGRQTQNLRDEVGDFVLRRADGIWAYQLACVVDDAASGVSDIVRGRDLLASTPRQIHLQHLLGLPTPRYLHLPLLRTASGRKLSKSCDDVPLDPADPRPALAATLRRLGMTPRRAAATPRTQLHDALNDFAPARLPREDIIAAEIMPSGARTPARETAPPADRVG